MFHLGECFFKSANRIYLEILVNGLLTRCDNNALHIVL